MALLMAQKNVACANGVTASGVAAIGTSVANAYEGGEMSTATSTPRIGAAPSAKDRHGR